MMADPLDDFYRDDRRRYEWIQSRPICPVCGNYIQDEYAYLINGEWYCPQCIKEAYGFVENEK